MSPALYATVLVAAFVGTAVITLALLAAWDALADRIGLGIGRIIVPLALALVMLWVLVYNANAQR